MGALVAENITVVRDGCVLLSEASIQLVGGELHVLMGTNGAGKSTLLRALSGEWPPHKGRITLAGEPLSQLTALQQARQRAVLPQHDLFAADFTVRQVVELGRYAAPVASPARQRRVIDDVMEAVDTNTLSGRRYLALSGGEQRRVQLARVLAQIWDLPGAALLLDEPVHSLDLPHQHQVMSLLRHMAAKGHAVVASLHDINLAAAYAHRISLLKAGRVMGSGVPDHILNDSTLQSLYGNRLQFTAIQSAADGPQQWLAR